MNLELKKKITLITGSSRGIGLTIAEEFLKEEAHVILTSNNEKELNNAFQELSQTTDPSYISRFPCDFINNSEVVSLKNYIKKSLGQLDIIVANVGGGESIPDTIPSKNHFDRVFNLNFTTALNTTRELFPLIKKSKGNIIYISSIAGIEAFGAPTDYSVAKTAIISLAKNVARKAAPEGVRVNCIAPGNIYFPGGTWDKKIKSNPQHIQELIANTVPMNRFGTPKEIAEACLFLASNRASFITGSLLCVDGGQTVSL